MTAPDKPPPRYSPATRARIAVVAGVAAFVLARLVSLDSSPILALVFAALAVVLARLLTRPRGA